MLISFYTVSLGLLFGLVIYTLYENWKISKEHKIIMSKYSWKDIR